MNYRVLPFLLLACLACGETNVTSAPDIYIDPSSVEFIEGNTVNTETLLIENRGSSPLQMRDFRLENLSEDGQLSARVVGDEVMFSLIQNDTANSELIELAPDASIRLTVTYEGPFVRGELGSVRLLCNDPDSRNVLIPIVAGSGVPEIRINPSTLDFETVEVGQSKSKRVLVTNTGLRSLEMNALSIEGSLDYAIASITRTPMDETAMPFYEQASGEIPYPVTVPPGETVGIDVEFSPTTTLENVTSDLVIASNADNLETVRVNLVANGARACIVVSPEVLDFGSALRVDSLEAESPNQRTVLIESCGTANLRIDRVELETDNGVFQLLNLPAVESGEPLFRLPAITPNEAAPSRELSVGFWPTELMSYGDRLLIYSNGGNANEPEIVDLFGRGTDNQCPVAIASQTEINANPLDILTLDGSQSMDPGGEVVQWEWTVAERPAGSVSAPVESYADATRPADGGPADDTATPEAFFFVDIAGRYTLELRVVDNLGQPSCMPPAAVVTVTATPSKDLHIELTWQTPNDPDETDGSGTDLDLHLRHSLATTNGQNNWARAAGQGGQYDCYYLNKSPNWGSADVEDNPSLDIDDTNGAGPENITMAGPEVGVDYDIGVLYFRARSTFGVAGGDNLIEHPTLATVRIFVRRELIAEFIGDLFQEQQMWHVARINWCENPDPLSCPRIEVEDRFYDPSEYNWMGQ